MSKGKQGEPIQLEIIGARKKRKEDKQDRR